VRLPRHPGVRTTAAGALALAAVSSYGARHRSPLDQLWLLRCFGAKIADVGAVVVFPTVTVHFPWKLTLEPRSMLGPFVRVYNIAPIRLVYGANVSQLSHLCAGGHDYSQWRLPTTFGPIAIGDNAWVAAEVFVGPGVEIGELAVVGARSVVVTSMPARKICVGHPCRPIKDRFDPV
jgi:putative colanic acid biosynthesis acetyltransferase WcaF